MHCQDVGGASCLVPRPELIGNIDEVTDVRLVGPPGAPTAVAVATNAPAIRLFDLATMACTGTLRGHSEAVLALDTLSARSPLFSSPYTLDSQWFVAVAGVINQPMCPGHHGPRGLAARVPGGCARIGHAAREVTYRLDPRTLWFPRPAEQILCDPKCLPEGLHGSGLST